MTGPADSTVLTGDATRRRVLERICGALGKHRWRAAGEGPPARILRENGSIRQQIGFGAYEKPGLVVALRRDRSEVVENEPSVQVNVYLGFSCEMIGEALRKLLPEDAAYLDARRASAGELHTDLSPGLAPVFAETRSLTGSWVANLAELDAWIDRFLDWYAQRGAPALDGCRDIASLDRLVHTPWSLQTRSVWDLETMLATLLVVYLSEGGTPFLDWLGVVRRAQQEMFRFKCEQYRDHPEWFKTVPPEVTGNAILERLIERLRRRREPNK